MKKNLKYILLLVVILLIVGRIWYVNQHVKETETVDYAMGEKVTIDIDGADASAQTYVIEVLRAELITADEMAERCQVDREDLCMDSVEYYYVIYARCGNEGTDSDNEHGIALINFGLTGTSYYSLLDDSVFACLNPDMPGSSFALKPGTSVDLIMPYQIIPEVQADREKILEKDEPALVVSSYPQRKRIQLHVE